MDLDALVRQYQECQATLGWQAADVDRVHTAADLLRPQLPGLVDDFYAALDQRDVVRCPLEAGQMTLQRLRAGLLRWLAELLAGPYDRDYVARRWQVGLRHVELNLEPFEISAALVRLRAGLAETLERCWPDGPSGLVPVLRSLHKLLDLDAIVMHSAYCAAHVAQIRRQEQLCDVGHVAGSVGHALRGPLNVLKTSAYYLRHARNQRAVKTTEHLDRIDRHMYIAEQVLGELSDFARLPAPRLRPFRVPACLDEALEQTALPANIHLSRTWAPGLPPALGDQDQVCLAFVRLLRRARERMRDQGQVSVRGQPMADTVEVVLDDSGPAETPDTAAALAAPLSLNNVRLLGMSLAGARAILNWNGGTVRAENSSGNGSKLTVALVAALQARSAAPAQVPN